MGPITLEIIIAHGSFSIFSFQLNFLFDFFKSGLDEKVIIYWKKLDVLCLSRAEIIK